MRQTATVFAWLCFVPGASWCAVLLDLECNDFRWQCQGLPPETYLVLGLYAAVLLVMGALASVTRGAVAIGVMWFVVLLFLILGAYGLVPEERPGIGVHPPSPIWYRGGRAMLLLTPLILVYAIRRRTRRALLPELTP